jgi:CubicO group peptidase (beta-lactamase class C family)
MANGRGKAGSMSKKVKPLLTALGLIALVTACANEDVGGEVVPADETCAETRVDEVDGFYAVNDIYVDEETISWDPAMPEDVGLDSVELETAADNLALSQDVASFLVVRHGKLAFESYFNGNEATYANNVHSLSKSILSVLSGLAVDDGYLSIDQPIGDLLPEELIGDSGDVTVRNLLTMSAGLEWFENETEYEIDGDHSHVAAVLAQPRIAPPGSEFLYNTGLTQTLSAVLAENIGDSLCAYAHDRLFEPLGIDVDHWKVDRDGYHAGGHSVFLTPRELATFGQLVLQGGVWGGNQLIPSAWLDESLTPTWDLECSPGDSVRVGYGYLWWLHDLDGLEVWTADGYAGQRLFVIPDLEMIVVMTHMTQKGDGIEVVSPIPMLRSVLNAVIDVDVPHTSDCSMWLEVHEIETDGTGARRLDFESTRAIPWSLSPDGTRFALHADIDTNFEIYTSAIDGSDPLRLTREYAADVLPDWSPDGTSIVFSRGEGGSGNLYTMSQDGTGLAQLTDGTGGEGSPTWSPDGTRVAFIQEAEGFLGYGSAGELWVVDAESGDTERLIQGPALYPDWSPDGSRIAYVTNTDTRPQIAILDIDSGEVTDLAPGFFPRWAPEGDRIAFVAEGEDGQELFVADVDGGGRVQLTDHPQRVVFPLWSGPDTIIFVADAPRG